MTKLIFLDIDGVLNSAEFLAPLLGGRGGNIAEGSFDTSAHIDPQRVQRLNRLIAGTAARVVLSSSWRLAFGREKTEHSLREKGFAHALADETPRIFGGDRHAEIKAYLASLSPPVRFVVLDDDAIAGFGLEENFVHVADGLEDEHVERARRLLLEGAC
jgi:hypothetical protein